MSKPVSAILSEQFGIDGRPGKKVECPYCHHGTFSIKSDDTLGKCFHPQCARFLAPYSGAKGHAGMLYQIHEKLFSDFHTALLELQNKDYQNAYSYCVQERGIHPRVVMDSMLGAVPSQYNVSELFKPHILEILAALKAEEESKKERGRSKKKKQAGATLEEQLAFLESTQEKLANCVNKRAGWLAFFYTDSLHRIVAVRFRKPYSKQIVFYKPTPVGGLFNHGLFTPYQAEDRETAPHWRYELDHPALGQSRYPQPRPHAFPRAGRHGFRSAGSPRRSPRPAS